MRFGYLSILEVKRGSRLGKGLGRRERLIGKFLVICRRSAAPLGNASKSSL